MTCCGYQMREAWQDGDKRRPVWLCLACHRHVPIEQALKLPGLQPGKQAVRTRQTEEGIQQRIVDYLRWHGYEVCVTVHRYRRQTCPKCSANFWAQGGYGASKGVGDLLVRHPSWPWWKRIEADVKRQGGRISPEQQARVDAGALRIWHNEQEAQADIDAAIDAAERELG